MKPTKEVFEKAVSKCNGNLSKVAETFKVNRQTVYRWINADEDFRLIVDDARMKLFDTCLSTAQVLATGIPHVDGDGRLDGWVERPDSGMLRYLLSTLGKREGFGESLDVTTNGKELGVNVFRVLSPDEIKSFNDMFDKEF